MDRKIKVVMIVNRFNIGGLVFNATLLAKYLGDDFETTLIGGVTAEGESDAFYILDEYGVKPIVIPSIQRKIGFFSELKGYRTLKAIIKAIQPDVVHTHASKAGFLGRIAARSLNVPVIVHTFHGHVFHSYFGKAKTELFRQIEKYLARKSTGIIAISKLQEEELVDEFKIAPREKFKIIPLGFDLRKFQENKEEHRAAVRLEYDVNENEVAIAIIGRLAPIKDHDYFLKVIDSILEKTKKTIRVFIVGDGTELEFIQEKANEINTRYPNTIKITSWIKDIPTFIHGMDVICLTSKNEGTPVSMIEAQAAGISVVSTDVGGVRDIIEDGKSGFVIKREDIETYIEKLRLLIESESLREKFSIFGQQNVTDRYSYLRLVEETGDYYKLLLNK